MLNKSQIEGRTQGDKASDLYSTGGVLGDAYVLRFDDGRNPPFWLQVRLTEADLSRMLDEIRSNKGKT